MVTWPFDSHSMISYRYSIGTDIVSATDFRILSTKCIEVTTLTFQGHMTSSVTWPFDSHYMIFYRCSSDTDPLSWIVFEILSLIGIRVATVTFQGHVTSNINTNSKMTMAPEYCWHDNYMVQSSPLSSQISLFTSKCHHKVKCAQLWQINLLTWFAHVLRTRLPIITLTTFYLLILQWND